MNGVKKAKGFTIVELLIILGIIIILLGIGTPIVYGMLTNSTKSADETQADIMTDVLEEWTVDYTNFKIKVKDETVGFIEDATSDRIVRVLKQGMIGRDMSGYTDLIDYMEGKIDITSAVVEDFETILLNENLYPIDGVSLQAVIANYLDAKKDVFEPQTPEFSFYYIPIKGRIVVNVSDATRQMIQSQIENYVLTDMDVVLKINGEFVTKL